MITKENFIILAGVVLAGALFYLGIIGLLGFTKHWSTLRLVMFYLVTVILFYLPSAGVLYMYKRMKQWVILFAFVGLSGGVTSQESFRTNESLPARMRTFIGFIEKSFHFQRRWYWKKIYQQVYETTFVYHQRRRKRSQAIPTDRRTEQPSQRQASWIFDFFRPKPKHSVQQSEQILPRDLEAHRQRGRMWLRWRRTSWNV